MRNFASIVALVAIAFSFTMPAAAGTADRTWVSHNGLGTNAQATPPCNPQQPCDTFAIALAVSNLGGEINCLDNGDYGTINIRSVSDDRLRWLRRRD
jgi:hypothetical protein